jgi:hypothetical protein
MRVCRLAHLAGHIEIARDKLEGSDLFAGLYIGQVLLSECRNLAKGSGATPHTAAMSGRFHGQFSYAARLIRTSISLRSAAKSIGLVSNASVPHVRGSFLPLQRPIAIKLRGHGVFLL